MNLMTRLMAGVCKICPVCIVRRARSDGLASMAKAEPWCPFCRAYDRVQTEKQKQDGNDT